MQDGTGLIQKLSATVSRLDTNDLLPWLRRMTKKPVNDNNNNNNNNNNSNNNNVSDTGGTEANNSSSMSAKSW